MTGLASAVVVVEPDGDCAGEPDPALVEWLRLVHPTRTWTLSVGTHCASASRLTDAGTPAKATAEIGELVSSYDAQRCS